MGDKSGFEIANGREVRRALRGFSDDVAELAEAIVVPVRSLLPRIESSARSTTQGSRVASALKVREGKVPTVEWGGGGVVVSGGGTATQLVGGVEFGGPSYFAGGGRRFPTPHSPNGKHLLPTLSSRSSDVADELGDITVDAWSKRARKTH